MFGSWRRGLSLTRSPEICLHGFGKTGCLSPQNGRVLEQGTPSNMASSSLVLRAQTLFPECIHLIKDAGEKGCPHSCPLYIYEEKSCSKGPHITWVKLAYDQLGSWEGYHDKPSACKRKWLNSGAGNVD